MPHFDRDKVVGLITAHYELLCSMAYIDRSEILYPPSGGWTKHDLDNDVLRITGRSETVIDLLRHLPYIRSGGYGQDFFIGPLDTPFNYLRNGRLRHVLDMPSKELSQKTLGELRLMPFDEYAPPRLVTIATGPIGGGGSWWVLDTEESNIYLCNFWYDNDDVGDEKWKANNPESVEATFNAMREKLISLQWVALPRTEHEEAAIVGYDDGPTNEYRRLYRECGWPDAFRRQECLGKVIDLRARHLRDLIAAAQKPEVQAAR